jgi:hypothetical protein
MNTRCRVPEVPSILPSLLIHFLAVLCLPHMRCFLGWGHCLRPLRCTADGFSERNRYTERNHYGRLPESDLQFGVFSVW